MKTLIVPQVIKIAVLRANALGDFIVALPALFALKAAYPQAEITLLAKPWTKEFLSTRPSPIDRVIVVPVSQGVRLEPNQIEDPDEMAFFFTEMKKERFDLAIQLHGGGRYSNPFIMNLGANMTIGLRTPDAPFLDRWVPYVLHQAEIHRYLEVVGLVGAHVVDLEPKIVVTPADLTAAKQVLKRLGYKQGQGPLMVVHPGASDLRRRWPAEKYAEIVEYLHEVYRAQVVVTGVAAEASIIDIVKTHTKRPFINAGGHLSLSALTGVLKQAQLVVTNDTGPTHVARALGTPTVTVTWGPNLLMWGPISRTWHRTVAAWDVICTDCGQNCAAGPGNPFDPSPEGCQHLINFVSSVTVSEVEAAVDSLLKGGFDKRQVHL